MAIMPLHWSVPINNLWKMDQIKMMAFTTQFCRFFFVVHHFYHSLRNIYQKETITRDYYLLLLFSDTRSGMMLAIVLLALHKLISCDLFEF